MMGFFMNRGFLFYTSHRCNYAAIHLIQQEIDLIIKGKIYWEDQREKIETLWFGVTWGQSVL